MRQAINPHPIEPRFVLPQPPAFQKRRSKGLPGDDPKSRELHRETRILIVEDELLVAENIKEILISKGYTVVAILPSGEEAIQQFENLDPDLVLMDIRLSGTIDGIQTAVVIHYTMKQVPILFLTAYGEEQFPHLAAVSTPLFRYLTKPYDEGQIINNIQTLITKDRNSKG